VGNQERTAGRELDGADAAKIFEYPACPGAPSRPAWDGWVEAQGVGTNPGKAVDGGEDAVDDWIENRETRHAFEAGRRRGRQEGRDLEREAQAAARKNEEELHKRQIAKLIANLSGERERLFQAVEPEVVKLALAIAARILRREAQMDPLLLMGAVRVALGQLAATTEVTLRVPAGQYSLWAEAVAFTPNLTTKPKVVAEERMRLGECSIESQAGTVDLGVRSQLGEIERGFFDRASAPEKAIAKKVMPHDAPADEVAGEADET